MKIAQEWKDKAGALQQVIDKNAGERERMLNQMQACISNADGHKANAAEL